MKLALPVIPKCAAGVKTELYKETGENKAKVGTRLYGCFTTVGFSACHAFKLSTWEAEVLVFQRVRGPK